MDNIDNMDNMDNDKFTIKIHKYSNSYLISQLKFYTPKAFFLKYKEYNLTPIFCFKYLYNTFLDKNSTEKEKETDNKLYYNEIYDHFKNKFTLEDINNIYKIVEYNKNTQISYRDIMKIYCNGKCNTCDKKNICF
jgi:hypothetical protein